MKHFMVFALLMLSIDQLGASEIECETKEIGNYYIGTWKGCIMQSVTAIDTPDSTISPRDETIEGLKFEDNKKIHFLPVKVAETFPNLVAYFGQDCSLTEVSKSNFANLGKLRILVLYRNQIIKIASNTFGELTSLERLELQGNRIKAINGEVFLKLKRLTRVWLNGNVCINEDFTEPTRITAMSHIVTQNCGLEITLEKLFEKVLERQTTNIREAEDRCDMAVKKSENRYDNLFTLFKDLGDRLEMQCNKTLAASTKDLIDTVNLKTSEIQYLTADLKTKNEEIDAKNLKIKELEEQVKNSVGLSQW